MQALGSLATMLIRKANSEARRGPAAGSMHEDTGSDLLLEVLEVSVCCWTTGADLLSAAAAVVVDTSMETERVRRVTGERESERERTERVLT